MKGILPASCRLLGYVLLLLAVFVPLLMYMFGQVNDGHLLYVKLGMKMVIWISLFMIFLARMKEEGLIDYYQNSFRILKLEELKKSLQ